MSSNNPVIQHEVIVYNITLCTTALFPMLYIQYVFLLRVTYSYACTADRLDYSSKYKSYASEPYLPVHSVS